jgi:GT2 family glycosyltransferase
VRTDDAFAPLASVVIATRNRAESSLRAVESCFQQDCRLEVILFDDASDDGTDEIIRRAFPDTRIFRGSARAGYIVNRNLGFAEAKGDFVFSLDDDAYFSEPGTVSRTLETFARDPKIGAVAIPYVEHLVRRSVSSLKYPFRAKPGDELRSYVGCAHAVRREAALAVGGYRDFFIHQGEERDFCLRLRAAGWRIVYGAGAPVVHLVSANRDAKRVTYYGARNQILFLMLNVPFPEALLRVVWVSQATIRYRFTWATLPTKLKGISAGLFEGLKRLRLRRPVSRKTYRRFRSLPAHGPEDRYLALPEPATKPPKREKPK